MNVVTLKRSDMIARLTKNLAEHKAVVTEALEGYRIAVIAELDRMIADAKNGKQIRTHVTLVQPVDHTRDYERVLDMLNLSVKDEIELFPEDFGRYMRDEWEWDVQFASSNLNYVRSARALSYLGTKSR